jgi:hypothetical protein
VPSTSPVWKHDDNCHSPARACCRRWTSLDERVDSFAADLAGAVRVVRKAGDATSVDDLTRGRLGSRHETPDQGYAHGTSGWRRTFGRSRTRAASRRQLFEHQSEQRSTAGIGGGSFSALNVRATCCSAPNCRSQTRESPGFAHQRRFTRVSGAKWRCIPGTLRRPHRLELAEWSP